METETQKVMIIFIIGLEIKNKNWVCILEEQVVTSSIRYTEAEYQNTKYVYLKKSMTSFIICTDPKNQKYNIYLKKVINTFIIDKETENQNAGY